MITVRYHPRARLVRFGKGTYLAARHHLLQRQRQRLPQGVVRGALAHAQIEHDRLGWQIGRLDEPGLIVLAQGIIHLAIRAYHQR